MQGKRIVVNDLMQQGYEYIFTAPMGRRPAWPTFS